VSVVKLPVFAKRGISKYGEIWRMHMIFVIPAMLAKVGIGNYSQVLVRSNL
jgi:hypothetical protein